MNTMTFGKAVEALKVGDQVRRRGWNGVGIFLDLHIPGHNVSEVMTHPYIYIDTTELKTDNPDALKERVPWLASQIDVLAEDWEIV